MSDYPAVFRNAAGDRMIVPNQRSGAIGFYRDPEWFVGAAGDMQERAAPPQPSKSRKVELKREEPKPEFIAQVGDADENPLAGFLKGSE